MNKFLKSLLVFNLAWLFSSFCFAQNSFKAKVVGVPDGDTITVTDKDNRQMMIRLIGADAPEKEQDFGGDAHRFLSNLVLNQNVVVSNLKKDCLDRLTASASFNNKDLSLILIKSGYAWADSSCQTDENLLKEESAAKKKKFGLWDNADAIRPTDFLKTTQPPKIETASQSGSRRIFTGLAPTPPPILTPAGKPSGIYIGMTVEDFVKVCGAGEKSKTYTSESSQSFHIDIPITKESSETKCGGSFDFYKSGGSADFKLTSTYQ